ncbi:uncharacterized protein RJT21DRAFT_117132 [Scheffersomyces amazonensis]|uniref:uncharacterized protein n=1 Tax=Scheffersomyces amazonensis TaxID=1078765 RepID=UPI00315D4002
MPKRITLTCSNCRARKVKCDRTRPICKVCLKNRIPQHLCIYEDSPHILKAAKNKLLKDKQEQENLHKRLHKQSTVEAETRAQSLSLKVNEAQSQSPLQLGFDNNGYAYTAETETDIFDLSNFDYYKYRADSYCYFGATSWRASLRDSVRECQMLIGIGLKTHDDLKQAAKGYFNSFRNEQQGKHQRIQPERLPFDFKRLTNILTLFAQDPAIINRCFGSETLFEYLNSVIDSDTSLLKDIKAGVNGSGVATKLCIIICIIVLSSFKKDGELDIDQLDLIKWAQELFEFGGGNKRISIQTLQAMILLFEIKKYDLNLDFDGTLTMDLVHLSAIASLSVSLGFHRDLEKLRVGNNQRLLPGLRNIWKWILFETTSRAFQYGFPPLINGDYDQHEILEDDPFGYKERIELIKDINMRVSSNRFSKQVNVTKELHLVTNLLEQDLADHNIIQHNKQLIMNDLVMMQTLAIIRFVKRPKVEKWKCEGLKHTLLLYSYCKKIILDEISFIQNKKNPHKRPHSHANCSYFLEAKEAIFRCTTIPMGLLLRDAFSEDLPIPIPPIELTFENIRRLDDNVFSMLVNSRRFLFDFLFKEIRSLINTMSVLNFSSAAMLIFLNNTYSWYYKNVSLNNLSSSPQMDGTSTFISGGTYIPNSSNDGYNDQNNKYPKQLIQVPIPNQNQNQNPFQIPTNSSTTLSENNSNTTNNFPTMPTMEEQLFPLPWSLEGFEGITDQLPVYINFAQFDNENLWDYFIQ